jgi:molecular chaperone GrpE
MNEDELKNQEQEKEQDQEPEKDSQKEDQTTEKEICSTCEEATARWKRALADYENLKKDLTKERIAIRQNVREEIAGQLIAVLDNFDQAARFQPNELNKDAETWAMGLMHVRHQLEGVMTDIGLSPFGRSGELFDPMCHEATLNRNEDGKKDQEILEVSQRGWRMGDKIVRPAKVVVNNLES